MIALKHSLLPFVALIFVLFCAHQVDGKISDRGSFRTSKRCTEERFYNVQLALAKIMSFGANGRPFPEAMSGVDKYCKDGNRYIHEVESFIKECVPKKIADVTVVILYSIKGSFIRKYCGPDAKSRREAEKLVKMAPCLNAHFLPDDRCIKQFINETKELVGIEDDNLKIPHSCCNYVKTLQCFNRQIDQQPCLEQSREQILDMIRDLFVAIVDIVCGEYNEFTDRCERLGPAPAPLIRNTKHYETFMFVLIDVLSSTKDFGAMSFRIGKVPQTEFLAQD